MTTQAPMSLDTFFEHLKECGKKWKVHYYARERIRLERCDDDNTLCPITAVCLLLTGEHLRKYDHYTAAQEIGLDTDTERAIVNAADSKAFCNPALRSRLLSVLGLTEAQT